MFGELCEKLHDCTFTEDCERISSPKIPAKVNRSSDAKVRELLSKVYQELHQVSLEQSSHMPYAKTIASDGFFEAAHAAIDGIRKFIRSISLSSTAYNLKIMISLLTAPTTRKIWSFKRPEVVLERRPAV